MSDWSFYDRGFSLFPIVANTKRPAVEWEGYQTQRAAPSQIAAWAGIPYNTGVATGAVSNCIVLDADGPLARAHVEGLGLPVTLTIATPRGTHWYFQHPGWDCRNRAGRSWGDWPVDGIDLRGDGGYVVGPGSQFIPTPDEMAKGKLAGPYAVELDAPIAAAPDWLLALTFPKPHKPNIPARTATETSNYGRSALNDEVARIMATTPGDGTCNQTINDASFAIGQLVGGGEIEPNEAWGALWEAICVIGAENDGKSPGTLQRGYDAGQLVPRGVEHAEPVTTEQALGTRRAVAPPPPVEGHQPVNFKPPSIPHRASGEEAKLFFEGCAYVASRDQMFIPAGLLIGKSAFNALYGGPEFILDYEGSKKTRSAWEWFRENATATTAKVWDICFRPELPPGHIVTIDDLPFLNTYVPIRTPRKTGDPGRFIEHVRKLLPNGRDAELLLHWMASAVQNPGVKFQWWPVVQGTKGNGKSLLLRVMLRAIGERYSHFVRADALVKTGNQFNDWIVGKLFLGFEEIRSSEGKRDFVEIMKDTVTAERLATEGKGRDQKTSDNRANGMMLTNHQDACPIDDEERRWGVFFTAQQSDEDMARDGMTVPYFVSLYEWLNDGGYAIVTNYLATMPLNAALDPARGLQRAPETTSTREAVSQSLGVVEQEILEEIEAGSPGFRGGIVSSLALKNLFDRLRKTISRRNYRRIMASLGYATHPAFEANKGRPNNPLKDQTRPTLYFAKDSECLSISETGVLMDAVERILAGSLPAGSNVIPLRPRV